MGQKIYDKYSLLHLAVGIVVYYFDISLLIWIILHIIFEIVENTKQGVHFIDNYLIFWPGGKKKPDSIINSISDIVCGTFGWILAYLYSRVILTEV